MTNSLWVPLANVRVNTRKYRKLSQPKVLRYAHDIDAGQQLPPIKVEHCGDGIYNIWDGRHRYLAHVELGMSMIEVIVIGGVTIIKRYLLSIIGGGLRASLFFTII